MSIGIDERDDSNAPGVAGAAHLPELRGAPRVTLLLRVAKLVLDDREVFCVVRDASVSGLKVKLFAPLPEYTSMAIEFANGDRHALTCVWATGDQAGLRFAEPVALPQLLEEVCRPGARRQVRLRIARDAMLWSAGEAIPVKMHDISQQGAGFECGKWLLLNELVRLELGVLPPVFAKVRWRNHPRYGVIFEQTFHLDDLAHRATALHIGESGKGGQSAPDGKTGKS